jgi:hypothetical protein
MVVFNRFLHQINDSFLGIEDGNTPCIHFHLFEALGMPDEFLYRGGETIAAQIGVRDDDSGLFFRHGKRIFHLVIVRREREWNQNRSPARGFDFSYCRGPGPGDNEIRGRILFVKIIEERTNVRIKAGGSICLSDIV